MNINLTEVVINPAAYDQSQVPTQFWSMIWAFLLLATVTIWIWSVMRKADPLKAPTNSQVIISSAIEGSETFYNDLTGGRIRKAYPYFMTIFAYLVCGIFIGMFGFESPASSLMFTFGLALISFIGIYVVGIAYKGVWGFIKQKYSNPLELFSQFGPLLSLAIRLFGGTFAFGVLFSCMALIFEASGAEAIATYWPVINVLWFWLFKSVDVFLSFLQAFVFMTLTSIYWSLEAEAKHPKKDKKAHAMGFSAMPTKLDINDVVMPEYNPLLDDKYKPEPVQIYTGSERHK